MREEIEGYEPIPDTVDLPFGADRDSAIVITFKNRGWLRVYEIDGYIEWY